MHDAHELELVLKSRIPIVVIETREEQRALNLIRSMQIRLAQPVFQWTVTEGLRRIDLDYEPQRHNAEPTEVLGNIKAGSQDGIYILLDFHPYLGDPMHVRLLKDIALSYDTQLQTIVLISHEIRIPPELKNFSALVQLSLPDETSRRHIVNDVAEQYARQHRKKVKAHSPSLDTLVRNLSGLTHAEATRLARSAIYDDGAITPDDLPQVMKAKYAMLSRDGMLTLETNTEYFSSIGGFTRLKSWLRQRQPAFEGRLTGIDAPKGILLLGVQGCGKSLAAKAVAGVLDIPLLRLEIPALFNKFHGETERNLRETLKAADNMAPCVLWIDELEKAISQGDHDGGTARRLLGSLLTWMAEKQSTVFIVATANEIDALPPELVRKGRFDEIFFVDLPDMATCERIFEIHLRKRGYRPDQFDCSRLAEASAGFSGAEVEQSVVAAIYAAHAQEVGLNQNHILQEIKHTRPLSIVMAERINALRQWAQARTVPVDE
ncbi:MAG: AAA family ATPase [Gammaproteobacteria bacterium]